MMKVGMKTGQFLSVNSEEFSRKVDTFKISTQLERFLTSQRSLSVRRSLLANSNSSSNHTACLGVSFSDKGFCELKSLFY